MIALMFSVKMLIEMIVPIGLSYKAITAQRRGIPTCLGDFKFSGGIQDPRFTYAFLTVQRNRLRHQMGGRHTCPSRI